MERGKRVFLNRQAGTVAAGATGAPWDFHRRLPGYGVTPLVSAPGIARRLGVGRGRPLTGQSEDVPGRPPAG